VKLLTILLISVVLVGCQSAPPPPPEPKGEKSEVNPPIVFLIDLYQKQDGE
jgi:hypothetical protein